MKTIPVLLCAAALAAALVFAPGFNTGQAQPAEQEVIHATPPMGVECRVQFRRDALGMARVNPPVPTLDSLMFSVVGVLRGADSQWVVVQQGRRELWIPREAVLNIEIFR